MNENRSFPWLFVLWLLAALGVPIGITTLRIEDIVQHPWLALGTCVIYEVLITMLGFATRVWSELEERWTPKIADAIEQWVARVSTPYRTRYKEFLINRHRDFDVKGLTTQGIYVLELEQVFVDLLDF